MRNSHFVDLVALATLSVGCSFDAKFYAPDAPAKPVEADAPPGPFDCYNQPLPAVAADPVVISGRVRDPYTGTKIVDAPVQGFQVDLASPIFTVITDHQEGMFSRSQGTGTAPRSLYLHVSLNTYVDTYFYPAVPIVKDVQTELQLFTQEDLLVIGGAIGVNPDPTKALLAVTVTDCFGNPLGGAKVSTLPAGSAVLYLDSNLTPQKGLESTDMKTGTALIVDAPPANVIIMATFNNMTLRAHSIAARAGALTQTEIQP
jgi:hypothetical protein